MAFTLSGSTITQTGTDTDLSGLAGIAGVTVETHGANTTYFVGDVKIEFAGECTIDPRKERLVYGAASRPNSVDILNGGVLNIGLQITENGGTYVTKGTAVEIPSTSLPGCCKDGALTVRSGGTLNIFGATILANACLHWPAGAIINIIQGVFYNPVSNNQRFRTYSTQGSINGFDVMGSAEIDFFKVFPDFGGYNPIGGDQAANQIVSAASGGSDDPFPFRDYQSSAVSKDWSIWRGAELNLINVAKQTPVSFGLDGGTAGLLQVFKEFDLTVTDSASVPIEGVKYYIEDVDNGGRINRIPRSGTDYDLASTKIYSGVSDASGQFPTATILTAVGATTGTFDYRSKSNDWDSKFDIPLIGYSHQISVPEQSLTGAGSLNWSWILLDDLSISEPDKAVVDAYTSLDDAYQAYDAGKSWLVDNFAGEKATLMRREGERIITDYDVVVAAAAPQTFDFDGSTITIKSNLFTGDITTTGAITAVNGASISGGLIDSVADSFLRFQSVSSWSAYSTEADAIGGTSPLDSGSVNDTFRFNYVGGAAYYLALYTATGARIVQVTPTLASGENLISLDTQSILNEVLNQTKPQAQRDAMLLAPTAGEAAATGSVDDKLVNVEVTAEVDSGAIAAAVWEVQAADHVTAGTMGEAAQAPGFDQSAHHASLDAYSSKADWKADSVTIDLAAIADAVWDEPAAEHGGAGSLGRALQNGATDPDLAAKVEDLHQMAGLDPANALTVTPTAKTVAGKTVTVSGDGITTRTETRTS